MMKITHIIFAFLVFLMFGLFLSYPIYLSFFAFLGVLLPDVDLFSRKMHRKLCHNIWFLMIVLFIAYNLGLDRTSAIIISIGFFSHLISDALTHNGITPLWPIKKLKFNGPIKTGGFGEYLIVLVLLLLIYWIGRLI